MNKSNILLFILSFLYINCSIDPEFTSIKRTESQQFSDTLFEGEDFVTLGIAASCVPPIPVTYDSTLVWLGLENLNGGNQEFGSAKAWVNHYDWEASVTAYYWENGISILFQTFRGEHHWDNNIEALSIFIEKNSSRCIRLDAESRFTADSNSGHTSYNIGEGDVGTMFYNVIPDVVNLLEINTLDTINNQISGNFTARFAPPGIPQLINIPDTVHFVNGSFSCQIID